MRNVSNMNWPNLLMVSDSGSGHLRGSRYRGEMAIIIISVVHMQYVDVIWDIECIQ